jgi:acyl-[acyl-carrier-protein]-phospholipid O-acyltransferase/long-chain-fatty-acid--[acyl-carrier-protein] ligase
MIMEEAKKTLLEELELAAKTYKAETIIAIDHKDQTLSYKTLDSKATLVAHKLKNILNTDINVGLMLPTSLACLVSFFAVHKLGKTPAMLNFTLGSQNLIDNCHTAQVKQIISSRDFIKEAKLNIVLEKISSSGLEIIFLEDIKKSFNIFDLLLSKFLPKAKASNAAVILFTSGTENKSKGVVLAHSNLLANINQLKKCFDYTTKDIVLNPLPLFHSFGLTGGMLMPLYCGAKAIYYPSPLHFKEIPQIARKHSATVFYGTNTFLRSYAKYAQKEDFAHIKYLVAGAEKIQEDVFKIWQEKFGVEILEAYGCTEAAPGISVNCSLHKKPGTVGKFLPNIKYKLEKINGIDKGYKLLVSGPNIMMGYLLFDKPGEIQAPNSEWYDTGDIIDIDEDGFIRVIGRVKRFAKIAGEMISLLLLEELLNSNFPDFCHAVVNISDNKKGEALVLFTNNFNLTRDLVHQAFKANSISELALPKRIVNIDELPYLGSGKLDYQSLTAIALNS